MKKAKCIVSTIITIAMLSGVLAGCGSNTSDSGDTDKATSNEEVSTEAEEEVDSTEDAGETTEITFWHTWGAGAGLDAMQAAVDTFNETNDKGIYVNMTYTASQASGNTQTMDKLMAAIAAGDAPDVALLDNFQVATWAAQDALEPLDDLMASVDMSLDGMYEWALEGSTYKGSTYSVPYNGDSRALFYNKDIFEAAGLSEEDLPSTIDELTELAQKLTIRDGANYTQIGFIPWQNAGKPIYCWGWNFGGEFYDKENNVLTLNDPAIVEALEWEVNLAEMLGGTDFVNFVSGLGTGMEDPFATGQLAMTVRGNFDIANLADYNPDLNYGVIPIPSKEEGQSTNMIGGWGFTIPKGAKNAEASIEFLKYMASEEASIIMAEGSGSFAPWPNVNEEVFAEKEHMDVFLQELEHGKIRPTVPVGQEVWDGLNTVLDSALHGEDTPENLLTELNENMNAELRKYD